MSVARTKPKLLNLALYSLFFKYIVCDLNGKCTAIKFVVQPVFLRRVYQNSENPHDIIQQG